MWTSHTHIHTYSVCQEWNRSVRIGLNVRVEIKDWVTVQISVSLRDLLEVKKGVNIRENAQTTARLHSFHIPARQCSKSCKLGFNSR